MVLDNLTLWKQYAAVSPHFEKAFSFLQQMNELTPVGRNPIDGDEIYAIVIKELTAPAARRQMEVHRKFIDIHYVHRGQERMMWAPLAVLSSVTMPYDAEQEASLFIPPPEAQMIHVRAGQFAIFFPGEGHIPSCSYGEPEEVFKAVIKVRV